MNKLPSIVELQWRSSGNDYTQYGFLLADDSDKVEIASTRGSSGFTDSAVIGSDTIIVRNMCGARELLYRRPDSD